MKNIVWGKDDVDEITSYSFPFVDLNVGGIVEKRIKEVKDAFNAASLVVPKEGDRLSDQKIDDYIKEKKYRYKGALWSKDTLGEIWSEAFSLYFKILGKSRERELKQRLVSLGIRSIASHNALLSALKTLGEVSKFLGDRWSSNWSMYVDLSMLWKFGSIFEVQELVDDVKYWFSKKNMSAVHSEDYYRYFRRNIEKFFDTYVVTKSSWQPISWIDWLYSGNWGTSGGTWTNVPLFRSNEGEGWKRVEKTKNGSVFADDYNELEKLLDGDGYQSNKVSIKPDEAPNKTRLIVSSDNGTYLLMSYISDWLENNIGGAISTLYMTKTESKEYWDDMAYTVEEARCWNIPLDQSKFDHHVTYEMIWIVLDVMRVKIPGVLDYKKAVVSLIRRLFNDKANVIWKDIVKGVKINEEVPWRGGVPSGWRWTAFMDTIVNYGEYMTVCDISKDLGRLIRSKGLVVQGDDDDIRVLDRGSVSIITKLYEKVGLEVNSKKFFADNKRTEFLRRYAEKGIGVRGYLARCIHSLLWRSPSKVSDEVGLINELVDNWLVALRRGSNFKSTYNEMLKDLAGATKLPVETIERWLRTPSPLGGAGIYELGRTINPVKIIQSRIYEPGQYTGLLGLDQVLSKRGLSLTDGEKGKIVDSMVKRKGVKGEKVTSVEDVMVVKVRSVKKPLILGNSFVTAIWKKEVPNWLREWYVKDAFDNGLMGLKKYLDVRCHDQFDRLNSQASRNVLKTWLLKGFSCKLGRSIHWDTSYVLGVVNKYWESSMKSILSLRKVNMSKILAFDMEFDLWVRLGGWMKYQWWYNKTNKSKWWIGS